MATFPKIGPLPVSQLSTDSLKSLLVSSYNSLSPEPFGGSDLPPARQRARRGKEPGLYDVDPTMTVADVVAMAGGVTPDGNSKRVELVRQGRRLPVSLRAVAPGRLAPSFR